MAAERAAQRAVEKVADALPVDVTQQAVVLDAVLKRPAVREAVAEAGIRTVGDVARSEYAMRRAREGLATIFKKRGPLTVDERSTPPWIRT